MAAPSCWVCLGKVYVKRVRSWTCPECNSISHMKCLIDYLTISDFNKIFCPVCNRIFTSQDLRDILNKKDYHSYLEKVINAEFEYFISTNMARVNQTIYYKNLWYNIINKSSRNKIYRIYNISNACFPYKSGYQKYIEDESFVDILKQIIDYGFDVYHISRLDDKLISPKIYRKVYYDDKDYEPFKDMPEFIGRHVFLNVTYENAIKNAEITQTQKPLMNCSKCEGLVVTFEGRAYCSECLTNYCIKCGEELPDNGTHECNKDAVDAFKLIKQITKPCPKCGVRIQKSEGCSQMFCTHCHTGFDWITGELITNNFHNPHRIAWLRSLTDQDEQPQTCCNIEDQIRQLERSRYKHIQYFSQFIGGLRSATSNFKRNDLIIEEKIYSLLSSGKPVKSLIKTYAGANYISQEYGGIISMFIDSVVSVYHDYTGYESDKIILEMLTNFMTDLHKYSVDISKRSAEKYFHSDDWLQYIVQWFKYIPIKEGLELDFVFTNFSRYRSNQTLRDEMMSK